MNQTLAVLAHSVGNERARGGLTVPTLRSMTKATLLPEEDRKLLIGSIIRRARLMADLTPPQLGERVGRSRGTVNDWESGKSSPSLVDLGPLCVALGVNPSVFVELPAMPPDPLENFRLPPAVAREIADEVEPAAEIESARASQTPTPLRRPVRRRRAADPQ
jgi:transcriptional regulator with XRE-family HTH domain